MVVQNLENLEKSENRICDRENLENSWNFTDKAYNDNLYISLLFETMLF